MYGRVAAFPRTVLMVGLLALAALACNFQSEQPTDEASSPTSTSTATATSTRAQSAREVVDEPTLRPPETLPAIVATAEVPPTETVAPTFTPIQAPTLAATRTSTATATRRPVATSTQASGSPPVQNTGPLSFEYYVEWRLKDPTAVQAIAVVTITAEGGGGGYTYYRDTLLVDGPIFEYEWATCRANPVSFTVTSASGESVEEVLFLHPPCPTATPTP